MSDSRPYSKTRRQLLAAAFSTSAAAPAMAGLSGGSTQPAANTIRDRGGVGTLDLSSATGSSKIGNGGESVADSFAALQLADYEALRAYAGPRTSVYVAGALSTSQPSGIAGWFFRDGTVPAPLDNNGTIIVARNGVAWRRERSGITEVDWFGAFGKKNSAPAIQAALDAVDLSGGGYIGLRENAVYLTPSGLTWDTTRVGIEGRGAYLWASSMTAGGVLLTPTQSRLDVNERTGAGYAHPVRNLRCRGPGYGVPALCVKMMDETAAATNVGNIFEGCTFQAWAREILMGAGSFFNLFERCSFQIVNASGSDTSTMPGIIIAVGENSGERNVFRGCMFGGRRHIFAQYNGNADTYFYDCSFDFCQENFMIVSGGTVSVIGGHTEAFAEVGPWYKVSGAETVISFSNHQLTISENKTNIFSNKTLRSPFYSDASCTNGGIVLNGINVRSGSAPVPVFLIDGLGRASTNNATYGKFSGRMLSSFYENQLTYGDFESPNWSADWVLTGTPPPSRSTAVKAHAGIGCLRLAQKPSDPAPVATATFIAKAGDLFVSEFYYKTHNINGTGAIFYITGNYVDKNGNDLAGQALLTTSLDTPEWTVRRFGSQACAPKGTRAFTMRITMFGATSGVPEAFVDSITITK